MAELTRRALATELQTTQTERASDISAVFALGDSGGSDIARHKDAYLAESGWNGHVRKTGRNDGE